MATLTSTHQREPNTLEFKNPTDKPLRVWFEPWGDFRDLQPGQNFDLEFYANVSGEPEVKRNEEGFVVCAWPSATLAVRSAGSEVATFTVPVPDVPTGLSVSSFLEMTLGKRSRDKSEI